ncbi:hypothetical protein QTG56_22375 (plasmid) [Rossellomorea sp. AcN35-11]|nr:hypothetical protein QTG56_22375 [Rossellomorea sp. AcN35-11]
MNQSHKVETLKSVGDKGKVPSVRSPVKHDPDVREPFYGVWKRTKMLLQIISDLYTTNILVNGIGEDNSAQGLMAKAIEKEIANFLNSHRQSWDPNNEYLQYRFEFQEKTFPDILLKKEAGICT